MMKILVCLILAAGCLVSAIEMWKQIVERNLIGTMVCFMLLMVFITLLALTICL